MIFELKYNCTHGNKRIYWLVDRQNIVTIEMELSMRREMNITKQVARLTAFTMCLVMFGCAGTKVTTDISDTIVEETVEIPVYEPTVSDGMLYADISSPEQLTFGDFDNGIGNFHPSGEKIVFQSFKDDKWQIFELSFSDMQPAKLLEAEVDLENPVWSNDGTVILYVQSESADSEWDRDIYMYDPLEEVSAQLTDNSGDDWYPIIMDDDNFIFLTERDAGSMTPVDNLENSVYTGNFGGATPSLLADLSNNFSSPAIVDSKRLLVLTPDARLAVYNKESGISEIITPARLACGTCDYSHNTGRLVFAAKDFGQSRLIFMDLESMVLQEVAIIAEEIRYPRFSPDGNWLLYSSLFEGHFQLFRINLTSN